MAPTPEDYDLIVVGSGFASLFFLYAYLKQNRKTPGKVLLLERGFHDSHTYKMRNRDKIQPYGVVSRVDYRKTYINRNNSKDWVYTPGLGGSSGCWWGCTPRFLPQDFRLRSLYGVGRDWPLSYEELEPHYVEAESLMGISGPSPHLYPMSRPYPLGPHLLNDFDRMMQQRYPGLYFSQPTARPSRSLAKRPRCCASGVCYLCPIDSKFTLLNSFDELLAHPSVTVRTGCQVLRLKTEGGAARSVVYLEKGKEKEAGGELFALGANAIFNPHILLNSGLTRGPVGEGLSEQVGLGARVYLRGVNNFQGSTSLTANGYMLYDGPHRKERAAALLESSNIPLLRKERGREREVAAVKFIFEDLPSAANRVIRSDREDLPELIYEGHSSYTEAGLRYVREHGEELFASLPVERIEFDPAPLRSEAHILGTAVMGYDSETSVVDPDLIHHRVRNLLVLGGSAFPAISPSNPTLTIAALSLRSARRILS